MKRSKKINRKNTIYLSKPQMCKENTLVPNSISDIHSGSFLNSSVSFSSSCDVASYLNFRIGKAELLSPNGLFSYLSPTEMKSTKHFIDRCNQREITSREINYVLGFGEVMSGMSNVLKVLLRRTPEVLQPLGLDLCGLVVILALDGRLITAYRSIPSF